MSETTETRLALPETAPTAPTERAEAAPGDAREVEARRTGAERAESAEDLSRAVEDPEALLERGLAEEESGASGIDVAINGVTGGIDKAGKMISPFIERITTFMESFRQSMRSSFGPVAGLLKKMGVQVPEWLVATVPGMAELTTALERGSRVLAPSPTDTQTMRELMALHQRAATAAGGNYSLEQFLADAVISLPSAMNSVKMTDVKARAEEVAALKEKEAEERRRTGTPAPASTPATPPAPATPTPPTA